MNNELAAFLADYLKFTLGQDAAVRAAEGLSEKYGSLGVIASSATRELAASVGMTDAAALSLKLLAYVHSRSITDKFQRPERYSEEELREYITALFHGLSVETVYCLLLDKNMRLIGTEHLGEGTVNSSEIYPRRILECACRRGAAGVIIAHNHPKGTAEASEADLIGTSFIRNVLQGAAIDLLGHYLVADNECVKMDAEIFK